MQIILNNVKYTVFVEKHKDRRILKGISQDNKIVTIGACKIWCKK